MLRVKILCVSLFQLVSMAADAIPMDVYLIGGQSNATGQGYLANLPPDVKPNEHVFLFHSGRPHLDSGAPPMKWMPLRQASETPDRFGPELGFGNRLQELMADRKIALLTSAPLGHTNWVYTWQKKSRRTSNEGRSDPNSQQQIFYGRTPK